MKAIKTLLAVSVLATAGVANAAVIAQYNVTDAGQVKSLPPSPLAGILTGTVVTENTGDNAYAWGAPNKASLDVTGATGVLTLDVNTRTTTSLGGTQHMRDQVTLNGNWDGTTFTFTSGSYTILNCVAEPGASVCAPNTFTFGSLGGSLTLAGGTLTTDALINPPNNVHRQDAYSFTNDGTVSSVPVPAAAWLFGSGLLGLAGTARRRRAA